MYLYVCDGSGGQGGGGGLTNSAILCRPFIKRVLSRANAKLTPFYSYEAIQKNKRVPESRLQWQVQPFAVQDVCQNSGHAPTIEFAHSAWQCLGEKGDALPCQHPSTHTWYIQLLLLTLLWPCCCLCCWWFYAPPAAAADAVPLLLLLPMLSRCCCCCCRFCHIVEYQLLKLTPQWTGAVTPPSCS